MCLICSFYKGADNICIVDPSDDGSLVEHRSFVAYYHAKKIPRGSKVVQGSVSNELLTRVCAGIIKSDEIEPWFRDKYNDLTKPKKPSGRVLRRE